MNLPFIVWTHDGKAPEILARAATLPEAKALWLNSKHAAISSGGVLADVRNTTGNTQARAMERAAEDAWRARDGAPAPAAAAPTRPTRPAATRPPLAHRRVTSVAGGTLTSTPAAAPPAPAAPPVPATIDSPSLRCPAAGCERPGAPWSASLASAFRPLCLSHRAMAHRAVRVEGLDADAAAAKVLVAAARRRGAPVVDEPGAAAVEAPQAVEPEVVQLLRGRADEAEAKVTRLQRLLNQVTGERDQYRGQAEGLTTDLDVARRDLARVTVQANEARAEKLEALGAEAFAWDVVDLAMTAGLDAVTEARAETTEVLRQAGELSRQLGAARDELAAQRSAAPVAAVPASVLLDELMLERIAQRAARKAVALQGDAAKLARLAQEHGGADAVARIVEGALALRKAVG